MVITRSTLDDRQRIEELEAGMAALKAQMMSHDRVHDIETAQRELSDMINALGEETGATINILREDLGGWKETAQRELSESIKTLQEETRATVASFKEELGELKAQVNLLVLAVGQPGSGRNDRGHKHKVPEPKHFDGARDAKELENFLFDMEQYFRAVHVESESDKVTMASMYLSGDAKLWWRSKFVEGECPIKTWPELKQEMKSQFFPENVDYLARRKLRELTQSGTVREYVRDFSTLMLDIRDMSEKDKLFYFLEGLKPWARTELQRQRVTDVNGAITAAERLTDYSDNSHKRKNPLSGGSGNNQGNGARLAKVGKTLSGGGEKKFFNKDTLATKSSNSSSFKPKPLACFLCNGPHRVAECPHRAALNAICGSRPESSSQQVVEETEEEPARMGSIRFLSALQTQLDQMKKEPQRGLMYVDLQLNGKPTKAMVDTGASDTFVSPEEARRCGIQVEKDVGQMKAVNSPALAIAGSSKNVMTKIGPWAGGLDFTVTPMDDFDVVLGLDFMTKAQAIPIPAVSYLLFLGDQPCVIPATILPKNGKRIISALQFKKGIKRGEPSYVVMPVLKGGDEVGPTPPEVKMVLEEFRDVMPERLP